MFDESILIKAISEALPEDLRGRYDDDDLVMVFDIIWDYYDEHGLLDIDFDESTDPESDDGDDLDLADLKAHVRRALSKDKNNTISLDDVDAIVDAEQAAEEVIFNEADPDDLEDKDGDEK